MPTLLESWRKPASAARGIADCSLVVATYKRAAVMETLLRLLDELPDTPVDVVVVDGSPDDDTERAIVAWASGRELGFDLTYVRSPAGLTRQRNVGVDASEGAFVFFLDDDCRPEPGYFEAIRRVFADDAAGDVGAVAGSLVNEMNRPLSLRWRTRLALHIAPRGEPGEYKRMGVSIPYALARPFTGTRQVMVIPGGASCFRRTVLERNRFSHFFYGYSQGEDLEMSLRIGRGHRLLWCGDAHVIHDHATEGRPSSVEKGRMEMRNRYFIWKRHAGRVGALNTLRFWADTLYSTSYDLISFARRPSSLGPLRHMWGIISGAAQCLAAPAPYEEPPARAEYCFTARAFPGRDATLMASRGMADG